MCTVFVLQANKHKDILVYSYAMSSQPFHLCQIHTLRKCGQMHQMCGTLTHVPIHYQPLIIPITLTLLAFVFIFGGISISCIASRDNDLIYKSFPFNILLTLHRMVCHRELCLASTNPLCHTSDLQWCVASPSTLCRAHNPLTVVIFPSCKNVTLEKQP